MMTIADICAAVGGQRRHGAPDARCSSVSTDSRTLKPGALFVPLVGERFDGHQFLRQAVERGASAAFVAEDHARVVAEQLQSFGADGRPALIEVRDTLTAYGDLAAAHRARFRVPVVAITGTSGKTTTKDLIAHVLGGRLTVLSNTGTQNNLVGVPATLLRLRAGHDVAVIECGTNQPGEIARLTEIVQPRIGVVTAIGPGHLEGLGTMRGVGREKRALLEGLVKPGIAVLNSDDAHLRQWMRDLPDEVRAIAYGFGPAAHVRATDASWFGGRTQFVVNHQHRVAWSLLGKHNVSNALAACAVGRLLGCSWEEMADTLGRVRPLKGRLHVKQAGRVTVIDDAYNANPLSVAGALEALREFPTSGRRLFVFGDMLELGAEAGEWHRRIGQSAADVANIIVTVGELAGLAADAAQRVRPFGRGVYRCRGKEDAVQCLRELLQPDDVVLVKGSHAVGLQRVVEVIHSDCVVGTPV